VTTNPLRTATVIAVAAGLTLLAAGCGGNAGSGVARLGSSAPHARSSSKEAAGAPQARSWLAFAHCMRSNGVSNFPDPNSSGVVPKAVLGQLSATNPRYRSASRTCQHLLPISTASGPTSAQMAQVRALGLKFARCMRAHHVNLPDPDSSGRIPDPGTLHPPIDQGSPQFQAANQACGRYRPPYMPSNAAYNAFARSGSS
jgi:hypothetical protein